jgi:GTP cyclohydrolase IB
MRQTAACGGRPATTMRDIQNLPDDRRINIRKVGVKNITYPITVLDKSRTLQRTVATVNMYVNLPHHFKGTHMSRFIEILNRFHGQIDLKSFHHILEEMKTRLQAEAAHMEIEFPYFLKRTTEAASAVGIGEYQCRMHGSLGEKDDLILTIRVPISPPLPVQQANGLPRSLGHWGAAEISLRFSHFIWIEELISMVEEETAHNLGWPLPPAGAGDPLTVEKITRALGAKFADHPAIRWFAISVENYADGLNTFASLEWPERPQSCT